MDGALIRFYWHMKGKTAWQRDVETDSGSDGLFKTVTGVVPGTWVMQARIIAEAGIPASTSAIRTTTLKDKVRFKDLEAWRYRPSQRTHVYGQMTDYIGGYEFTSVRGKVKLYYRRKGKKAWHYYRTTTLRKPGSVGGEWFAFDNLKPGKGYYFRVTFPAQGFFLAATSPSFKLSY